MMRRGSERCNAGNEWIGISKGANRMTDATPVATEITRLIATGEQEHEPVARDAIHIQRRPKLAQRCSMRPQRPSGRSSCGKDRKGGGSLTQRAAAPRTQL